ncbi:MAG TPA: DNA polymerase [Gammaproteobacteria bacterium]|nr:DNA polymerase [Gammaproteobacteria bacterium]
MNLSRIVVVDFETDKIEPRPKYPPEPAGVALCTRDQTLRHYFAWNHRVPASLGPSYNNCTKDEGRAALLKVWEDPSVDLLFHNAPFDISVAVEKLDLPMLPWHRVHDTQLLLFLYDPHAKELSLKPAAEKLLGWAPEERDEVHEWIYANRKVLIAEYGGNITRAKKGDNSPSAWIAYAPATLVGRYAVGDVERTLALFRFLYPLIVGAGMYDAYERERRVMPILLENERVGLRADVLRLSQDIPVYRGALHQVESAMRHYLDAPELNFDNDKDVAAAFEATGAVKEDMWVKTAKSEQLSISKDNLPPEAFVDPLLASAFGYRNRLVTSLKMFMEPWLEKAVPNGSYIHTKWNQVRNPRGGTRTGRPSMTDPNLLNVSKTWDDRTDGYVHPTLLNLPELPLTREYILPDGDEVWVHRDFDGQELRIFAHFECGELMQMYLQDPMLDPHGWVKQRIIDLVQRDLERTQVKTLNFQSMYGGGIQAIQTKLRCSAKEAKEFKAFHDQALPGRKILSEEIQRIVRRGDPIRTWGGRQYYVEPPSYSEKHRRRMTWEYKLINYLIQGSAADVTKEAIARWHEQGGPSNGSRFLLTVYDEINLSAPRNRAKESMAFLRSIMDGMELDVPMRSSGKIGERWGALTKVD